MSHDMTATRVELATCVKWPNLRIVCLVDLQARAESSPASNSGITHDMRLRCVRRRPSLSRIGSDVINGAIPRARPAGPGQGSTYIRATGYSRLQRRLTVQRRQLLWRAFRSYFGTGERDDEELHGTRT
jgi:hypothetical protein